MKSTPPPDPGGKPKKPRAKRPLESLPAVPVPAPGAGVESLYMEVSPKTAADYLRYFHRQFPFADWDESRKTSRSLAVHIAAMISQVVTMIVPKDSNRMGFLYNANTQRSGKTLLAQVATIPVHGRFRARGWPAKDEEMTKVLDSEALAGSTYICFDNVRSGFVGSQILEAFMTTPIHSGRVLGASKVFEARNLATIFITGNNLDPSIDIQFRTLLCSLFVAEADPTSRKIDSTMDAAYLGQWATRRQILSALWSLVKDWHKNGMPKGSGPMRPGFENWGSIVGGIVENAGLGNPLAMPAEDEASGKSNEEKDIYTLITHMAASGKPRVDYTFQEIINICYEQNLFAWFLEDGKEVRDGSTGEVEWQLKPSASSSLGKLLHKWFPYGRQRVYKINDGSTTVHVTCTGKNRHRRYVAEQ